MYLITLTEEASTNFRFLTTPLLLIQPCLVTQLFNVFSIPCNITLIKNGNIIFFDVITL